MTDDRDDLEPGTDSPSDEPAEEPTADSPEAPEAPETPFDMGGIDPQEIMRDPMGAVFKMMSDPNAMQAFEGFLQSPMAQQMLSQGFNNPMIQQMVQNNPMLSSMMNQAEAQGIDLSKGIDPSTLFGGRPAAAPQPPAPAPAPEVVLDEPRVALLDPPIPGTPAYPDPSPIASWGALLSEMPADARDAVLATVARRVKHHLGDGLTRLEAAASQRGAKTPEDLLVCQGAFAGEVAWYAICQLEEEHALENFVVLAQHALRCVTFNSGYRVPSFVTQLVQFLLDLDALQSEDLRHAIWALSGQPEDGVVGVFEVDLDQLDELVTSLDKSPLEDALVAAFYVAVVGWNELELDDRPRPFAVLLESVSEPRRDATVALLSALSADGYEVQGMRFRHLSPSLQGKAADAIIGGLGVTAALSAGLEAHLGSPWAFHRALLDSLDVHWHDAEGAIRTQYLDRILGAADDNIRRQGYSVGAAWAPHEYLGRAAEDASAEIRRWAEDEAKTL